MNDNDIIKALEVCAGIKGTCSAYDCSAFGRISDHRICAMRLKRECYDLINRQKAEIERLNRVRAELSQEIDRLKTEMSYMKSPNTIGDTHEMGAW